MKERLVGLDLLRSIIMFFGPTFHASMLLSGAWGFQYYFTEDTRLDAVLDFTHYFRMELFFLISGFFSSLVISKKGAESFIENRMKRIILPTLSSIFLILPLISFEMLFLFSDKNIDDYLTYKHIWFLVTLSVISLVIMISPRKATCLMEKLANILNLSSWFYALILMCVLVYACITFNVVLAKLELDSANIILSIFQINPVINYASYYIIGMILFFMNKTMSPLWSIISVLSYCIWFIAFQSDIESIAYLCKISKNACALLICLGIFSFFKGIRIKESNVVVFLTKIALPFYLCHLPILLFLSWIWVRLDISSNPYYFITFIIPSNCILSMIVGYQMTKHKLIRKAFGLSEVYVIKRKNASLVT